MSARLKELPMPDFKSIPLQPPMLKANTNLPCFNTPGKMVTTSERRMSPPWTVSRTGSRGGLKKPSSSRPYLPPSTSTQGAILYPPILITSLKARFALLLLLLCPTMPASNLLATLCVEVKVVRGDSPWQVLHPNPMFHQMLH